MNRLVELGLDKLDRNSARVPKGRLAALEKKLGVTFPADYRAFLTAYGNTMRFYRDVHYRPLERSPWTKKNGLSGFDVFYGLEDDADGLKKMMVRYEGRIHASVLPIAEAPGGNQICLGIRPGPRRGKVYFWDHDHREPKKDHLYSVARSFDDFIASFELEDP